MKIQDRIKTKGNKGITLIALVITIIVLLILAGVTISALSGDNGILTRAKEAKEKTEQAQQKEEETLLNMENVLGVYNFKNVNKSDTNPGGTVPENSSVLENDANNGKYKVKLGIVVTGDIFCTDEIMKEKIHTKFDADVVDMECAAIAQVAYLNKKPFVVVRCISDAPNGENASVFDENLEMAANRCAKIITEFMNNNLN